MTYYVVNNHQIIKSIDDGFILNKNNSEFASSLRIFPLVVDRNSSIDIYMKMQNFNHLDTPYKLVTKEYLINFLEQYNFLQGMFFAIILIMGIYNLIIYLILKHKVYLYHVIYTVLLIVYQGGYFGYSYKLGLYLIPTHIQFTIGGVGFLIFVIFFFEELLSLKKHLPRIYKILFLSIFFFITCFSSTRLGFGY